MQYNTYQPTTKPVLTIMHDRGDHVFIVTRCDQGRVSRKVYRGISCSSLERVLNLAGNRSSLDAHWRFVE